MVTATKGTSLSDVTLYSLVEIYWSYGWKYCLHLWDRIVVIVSPKSLYYNVTRMRKLLHAFVLKLEGLGSSETSLGVYQTTWRHIPEDSTLYSDRYGTLSFNFLVTYLWSTLYNRECRMDLPVRCTTQDWSSPSSEHSHTDI
jgi:hypothetical protein